MNAANGTSRFIHRFTFINLFLHYCITCLDESCFSHNREITARLKGSLSIANRNSEPSIVHALAVNKGLPVPFLSSQNIFIIRQKQVSRALHALLCLKKSTACC